MGKNRVYANKNNKTSYFVILGIMCFAIMLVITAAVKNDIARDINAFSNTVIDIIDLIFLALLFGFLFSSSGYTKKPSRSFMFFIVLIFTSVSFSAIAISFYGMQGTSHLITAFITLAYFFSACFYIGLWGYQKQFLKDSKMKRIVTVLISAATLIYITALVINLFVPVIFIITEDGFFADYFVDYFSFTANLFCITVLIVATLVSDMELKKKLSFISFLSVPAALAILSILHDVLGWKLFLTSVADVAMTLSLYIIFFNIHVELRNEIIRHEKEELQLKFAAMISQIQPHFVYNSLSIIAALCEEDPKLAADAAGTFSDYLRENIDYAGRSRPIAFSEELKHIKAYMWLEQLRFPNKLHIEYDIKCTSFSVPALSVQPLAENAVKHGICKTRAGGTVRLSTFEDDKYYFVTVSDDGAGFVTSKPVNDGKQHIGIENARFRIREMLNGRMDIKSTPGKGTTVTISIPKGK